MADSKIEELALEIIKNAGLPDPVREYRFHPTRRWRLDLAYPDIKLGIELEGGTFGGIVKCQVCGALVTHRSGNRRIPVRVGGRHNIGASYEKDLEKYSEAAILGWTIIRFTGAMLKGKKKAESVDRIKRAHKECLDTLE